MFLSAQNQMASPGMAGTVIAAFLPVREETYGKSWSASRIILLVALTALCIDYAGAQFGASGRMTGRLMIRRSLIQLWNPGQEQLTGADFITTANGAGPGTSSSPPGNTPSGDGRLVRLPYSGM